MKHWLATGSVAVLILFACPTIFADVAPPECWEKKVGDACTNLLTDKAGSCRDDTCTSVKPDAAPVTSQCLTCTGDPPLDDGACTIGKHRMVGRTGPWLLAGLFSVLFLIGRRRRPRR